ncbi:MAG: 3-deoxy-D-manno-octulosonic acid transferase [Candidatus Omnitrophica bacterium]|nr:3-deoxy-D-manno-octulosonic acid transferase [Candidatus Omnitrophota bacterium]
MRFIYDIAFALFSVVYLPYFLIKRKYHPEYLQRFGIFKDTVFDSISKTRPIWIHAVSVGEMRTAATLINGIRRRYPKSLFVISNVTKTGHDIAASVAAKDDIVIYFPVDISFVVRRLVTLVNPKLFVFIETEIWPNLITELHKRKVPIVLMNGRISPASFRNYRLIKPIMRPVLEKITLFCMRTEDDAARIKELGAKSDDVVVSGNMKFDSAVSVEEEQGMSGVPVSHHDWLKSNKRLFVAGSTHRGEDSKIINSYRLLKRYHPELQLLIAPRHVERTGEIATLIKQSGFTPVKVSEIELADETAGLDREAVFILDSMGRLNSLYKLASIVFIGGSLIPHGGHNFLEPAIYAKPLITGCYVHNFKDMFDIFLKNDAIKVVHNESDLVDSLKTFLEDDKICVDMGNRAKDIVLKNVGSTDRNLDLISEYLN